MTSIEILREMIKPEATIPLQKKYDKWIVVLDEPTTLGGKVNICDIPENTIVIKGDFFPPPTRIFSDTKGECSRADFIIISEIGLKSIVLFIELKETNHSGTKVIKQLNGAYCAFLYMQQVGIKFWQEQLFLKGFEPRFLVFTDLSINKRMSTYKKKEILHNKPENVLKIYSPRNLRYNHLAKING